MQLQISNAAEHGKYAMHLHASSFLFIITPLSVVSNCIMVIGPAGSRAMGILGPGLVLDVYAFPVPINLLPAGPSLC